MPVIKADALKIERPRLESFRLDDVMREAREAIAAARARAAEIVREAEAQAAGIREAAEVQGRQEGLEQGRLEGRAAGRAEAFAAASKDFAEQQKSLISTCQQLVAGIEAGRASWQAAARQDLIELALAIAKRVVQHVGQHEREAVLANLEEAVRIAGARSDVSIVVNPADAEAARLFAKSLVEMQEQWKNVRVVQEPEVSPGGCRVQWGSGAIDATLETQFERITEALRGDGGQGDTSA